MGKITGFTFRKALTITNKTGILMKLNGQINYKYLLLMPLFSVIVFTIVYMFSSDFSYEIDYLLLESSASSTVITSMLAISQTYIQLKQKERMKDSAQNHRKI